MLYLATLVSFNTYVWIIGSLIKIGHSRPLLPSWKSFLYSWQLINVQYKFWWWLDSSSKPMDMEATAPPTEQQPPPMCSLYWSQMINYFQKIWESRFAALQKTLQRNYWRLWFVTELYLNLWCHTLYYHFAISGGIIIMVRLLGGTE